MATKRTKTKKAVKPAPGTKPTQIRLTPEDHAAIKTIRTRYGLPSVAAAVRYAVQTTLRAMDGGTRKKNPEKPETGT